MRLGLLALLVGIVVGSSTALWLLCDARRAPHLLLALCRHECWHSIGCVDFTGSVCSSVQLGSGCCPDGSRPVSPCLSCLDTFVDCVSCCITLNSRSPSLPSNDPHYVWTRCRGTCYPRGKEGCMSPDAHITDHRAEPTTTITTTPSPRTADDTARHVVVEVGVNSTRPTQKTQAPIEYVEFH